MKKIKYMPDAEFERKYRIERWIAQSMMLNQGYSVLPDRPMLPGTKMSGGDRPGSNIDEWLSLNYGPGYNHSANKTFISGEIKGK